MSWIHDTLCASEVGLWSYYAISCAFQTRPFLGGKRVGCSCIVKGYRSCGLSQKNLVMMNSRMSLERVTLSQSLDYSRTKSWTLLQICNILFQDWCLLPEDFDFFSLKSRILCLSVTLESPGELLKISLSRLYPILIKSISGVSLKASQVIPIYNQT